MRSFLGSKRLILGVAIALCMFVGAGTASADVLNFGNSYTAISISYNGVTSAVGGGSFNDSKLNGVALPFIYCVDLDHHISLGATYSSATVTNNGGGLTNEAAVKVAWLLTNYGNVSDSTHMGALQAAIWKVIYGDKFELLTVSMQGIYGDYLAAVNTAYTSNLISADLVANFAWIDPGAGIQKQVTKVPEPSLILLLGIGLGAVSLVSRRLR
jgi:hypothetical protein